ncbi:THAP domain-containing protein 6-like [Aphis craccivora]|uniref:THAP domain-containing protein 6-like n=1 Tax=Aphis craccivora TaxID=307492 RepID=A0A6G0YVS7_APHCR|nr:THAP domain-containing protein 6-like [Aphis craccivora]
MNLKCCVRSCQQAKSSHIQLFPFPKNLIVKRKWLIAINKSFIPRRHHRICLKHFEKESYVKIDGFFVLKKNAIPRYIHRIFGSVSNKDNMKNFIRSIVTEDWIVKRLCKSFKCIKNLNEDTKLELRPLIEQGASILIRFKYFKDLLEDVKNNNIPHNIPIYLN